MGFGVPLGDGLRLFPPSASLESPDSSLAASLPFSFLQPGFGVPVKGRSCRVRWEEEVLLCWVRSGHFVALWLSLSGQQEVDGKPGKERPRERELQGVGEAAQRPLEWAGKRSFPGPAAGALLRASGAPTTTTPRNNHVDG